MTVTTVATKRLFAGIAAAGLLATLVTGCSSSGPGLPTATTGLSLGGGGTTGSSSPTLPGTTLPGGTQPGTTTAAQGAASPVSERFVNALTVQAEAGPALDIYDTPIGQAAKPLVGNLAYGAVSAYVHPHLVQNSTDIIQLYALPAGEDPVKDMDDAKGIGGLQDDGTHPQLTLLLQGEKDTIEQGKLAGLSFSEFVEKGTDNGYKSPVAPPADAGKADLLAAEPLSETGVNGAYLMIDSSCSAPENGLKDAPNLPEIFPVDDEAPISNFAIFDVAPGQHTVAVATTDISDNLTCAELTHRQGMTTVDVTSGQQVEVWVYGTGPNDLHLVFAPVQA